MQPQRLVLQTNSSEATSVTFSATIAMSSGCFELRKHFSGVVPDLSDQIVDRPIVVFLEQIDEAFDVGIDVAGLVHSIRPSV